MEDRYKIMGRYNNGATEEIDSAPTEQEADFLRREYIMAFGRGWNISVQDNGYQELTSP